MHGFETARQISYDMGVAFTDYLETLRRRAKESHVYRPFQLHGLEIAEILGDEAHKSLYIKLAKEYRADRLLALAKSISENEKVKQRGAYFMAVLKKNRAAYRKPAATKKTTQKDRPPHERKNPPARRSRRGKSAARKNKKV